MIKNCKSLNEFEDELAVYCKYRYSRWYVHENEPEDSIVGVSYVLDTSEKIKEYVAAYPRTNWMNELICLFGKRCTSEGITGIFEGCEVTEEDIYYILRCDDGTAGYATAVGKIEEIK